LLGGSVGVGTVAYALAIGPLTQAFLPVFTVRGGAVRGEDERCTPTPAQSEPEQSAVRYRLADASPQLPDPDPPARPASVHP
jgi:hypothetical protein